MDLLDLDEHTRCASLGNEYYYLKSIYYNWSDDLHAYGNTLDNHKLEMIGINGLVLWYFENKCPIPVTYNFNYLETFVNNTEAMTYYDFINILKLLNYLNIKIDEIKTFNFNYKTKYRFLMMNKKQKYHEFFINKFGYFLNSYIGKDKLNEIIISCNEFIKSKSFWFNRGTIFDTFVYNNEIIKKWVIIFQKFKVIVEKMSYEKHKDVFTIDRFVENTQQLIYTFCIYYINNFMEHNEEIIAINHKIIKCLENERLLDKFETFDRCIHLIS